MTIIFKIFAWIIYGILATFVGNIFVEIFKEYWKEDDVHEKIINISCAVLVLFILVILALIIGFVL